MNDFERIGIIYAAIIASLLVLVITAIFVIKFLSEVT